ELSGALGGQSEEQVANRLRLVMRLALCGAAVPAAQRAGETPAPQPQTVVAPIQALMQPVPSKRQLSELVRDLRPGQALEPEKLIVWLSEHGYNRLEQVEVPGDFAVRGGIV